jgi:CRP/FNR family transcriptional regulator
MVKENICNCKECEKGWPVFKALNKEELEYLNTNRFEAGFKPGEVIFKQGSPASNVVFLLSGMAKIYMEGQGDRNLIVDIVRPGKMIVGPGIYTDQRNMYTVSALNEVRACFIDSGVIKNLVRQSSAFAEGFITDISYRSEYSLNKLMSMTQKKMPGRVAEILLYLSDSVFESDEFDLFLSRQELADMAGMAKESVVRILKEFSNESIIDSGCSRLKIIDKVKLKMISMNG